MTQLPPGWARCHRCGAEHGREDEPPLDWAPLADDEGLIAGVVCPGCREMLMDQPLDGLTILSPAPAPSRASRLPAQVSASGAIAVVTEEALGRFRLAYGEWCGHLARRTDRYCRHRARLAPCIIRADDPEIGWCADCLTMELPDGSHARCAVCGCDDAGPKAAMAVFGDVVVVGAVCADCAGQQGA